MKRKSLAVTLKLIVLIIFISNSNTSFSQSWPMPGAVWRYCVTDWFGPSGYLELGVIGDTIILGEAYDVISFLSNSNDTKKAASNHSMTLFTRFSNDTVYRFVNNKEYIYFTFNLNVGDVFETFRTAGFNNVWSDSACNSIMPLKVIESGVVEYGGQILKRLVLYDTLYHYLYPNAPIEDVEYIVVERIGVINTYPLINTREPPNSCFLPSDWVSTYLARYNDNSFQQIFDTCMGIGLSEILTQKKGITIYPNPAKGYIEISQNVVVNQYGDIHIYSISGNLLLNKQILEPQQRIDLSNFSPGYYILRYYPKIKSKIQTFPIIIFP